MDCHKRVLSSSERLQRMVAALNKLSLQHVDTKELKHLLRSVDPDERSEILQQKRYDETVLDIAALRNHPEIIRTILTSLPQQERLDVLISNKRQPLLHAAAWWGHTESVRAILSCLTPEQRLGIISAKCCRGYRAIDWALDEGHEDTVTLLRGYRYRANRQIYQQGSTAIEKAFLDSLMSESEEMKEELNRQSEDIGLLTEIVTTLRSNLIAAESELFTQREDNFHRQQEILQMRYQLNHQQSEIIQQRDEISRLSLKLAELESRLTTETANQTFTEDFGEIEEKCISSDDYLEKVHNLDETKGSVTADNQSRRGGEKGQITSEDYQHEIGKLDETVGETVTDSLYPMMNLVSPNFEDGDTEKVSPRPESARSDYDE